MADLRVPLVNNVDAGEVRTAAAAREGLKRQVTSPVRWEQSVRVLQKAGVGLFIEVGPGKVLSGLVKQIDRQAQCLHAEDWATLNEIVGRLESATVWGDGGKR
jgi:[acyl-carrier-protein] S-malonyltransferase